MPESSVKAHAVIFDMDGVLFDTERLCASVWSECSRVAGYAISDEVFRMCVGRNDADTRELLRETLGSEFPYDTFKERVRLEMKSVMEANGPPPKKGAAALLQYLSDNQIPAALATSTSEETARWMIDKAGFSRFFSAYAFGSEVSKGSLIRKYLSWHEIDCRSRIRLLALFLKIPLPGFVLRTQRG